MQIASVKEKRNALQDEDLLCAALCHARDILIIWSANDPKWARADILVLVSMALAATLAIANEKDLFAAKRDGRLFDFVLDFVARTIRQIEAAEVRESA
jgi:hypothetical protein